MSSGLHLRCAALAILSLWLCSSCLERRSHDDSRNAEIARCAECHGEPERAGDHLARSAPPRDLRGASSVDSPGVGAHAIHLNAGATHAPFACNECHVVPDATDSPGHADTARPAELTFGALASTGQHRPAYDPVARKCSETWCHRAADAVWNQPKSSDAACGSCHGLPPPSPHPQSERCSVCHAQVVDEQQRIIAPSLHVDGRVQYGAGECASCHGSLSSAAPPLDTLGNGVASALGVGAHTAHLSGGGSSRALECSECHRVPIEIDEPTHADGLPAEVALTGVAEAHSRKPRWLHAEARCADSWCHAPSTSAATMSPVWNEAGALPCNGCHGLPPPPPHPVATQCSFCHGEVVGSDNRSIVERARHVDGVIDVNVGSDCTGCHGSLNPAPPFDLAGNNMISAPGVGAHQVHIQGTPRSKAVPCESCHRVPENVLAPGHLDGQASANVVFSGVALAHGASPSYVEGRCENTACHGAVFPERHESGGTITAPLWTRVDGTQAPCGSCHALPPPRPHPYREQSPNCSGCHENLASDNMSFIRPDLHVDGEVTFTLP
ncbi:MAG: CxxxxCH/CxxCH domain c-type cytochrome [Myxococcota bacterium]